VDSSDFLFGCKAKYLGEYYKGIITKDQEVKVPAVYRDIIKRQECYEVRMQKDSIIGTNARAVTNTYGLLDNKGLCVIPCQYEQSCVGVN